MGRIAAALKVRPGEGRVTALLVGLMLATSAGGSVGGNAIEALFYARFGVQFLPYMYVALGIVTILTTVVVTALLGRVAKERLYVLLPPAMAAVLAGERAALALDIPALYPLMFLLMNVMGALQGLLTWGLAGAACDTRQAKRLFPLFAAGGILGAVLGGFATQPLAAALRTENLLLVWAAALAVAFVLGRLLVGARPPARPLRRRARLVDDLQQGLRSVRRSALLGWMALAVVLFSVLYFSVAFPFSKAATAEFPDADALAGFLGVFQGASTAAAFGLSLLLANRLFARFGIMSTVLAFTLIYLAGFGVLAVAASFPMLVAFRFAQMAWLMGVAGSAYQAMFNVVPPERRDQTRAFMDGVPGQAGTVIAGVILVVGEQALEPRQLYLIGLAAAAAATLLVWRAALAYLRALVDALRAGMPQLFFAEEEPFGGFRQDAAAVATALAGMRDPDPATRRVAAEVVGRLARPDATRALADALDDADGEVRAIALRGLARGDLAAEQERVAARLGDADPRVRAWAAIALLRRGADTRAAATLDALAGAGDAHMRALAAEALGELGDAARTDAVTALLADASPVVRRAAALAAGRLDPALALAPLARALADPDRIVRDAAAEGLARVGAPALEAVLAALGDPAAAAGALDALERLPRADPAAVRAYAGDQASRALRYHDLGTRAAARAGEAWSLLAYSLERRSREHATNALRAIGTLGDRASVATALSGLASRDPRQRATAAETLESIGDRDLARALLPVWEASGAPAAAGDGWLGELERDPDPWLRECAAFAAASSDGGPTMQTLTTLAPMERILFLRRVPLFADLPPADLKQLAAIVSEQLHADGEVICEQGEPGDELYVIVSGDVRVLARGNEIARRRAGEFVGDVALITAAPRNATLVASGEVRLLSLERRQFESLLRERPDAGLAVMRVLASRLTELTERA